MIKRQSGYLLALLLVGCSAPNHANDSDTNKQPAGYQSSASANLPPNQPALPFVAMNALNDCVSSKVTSLVNAVNGNVDEKSTADIAAQAVSSCDGLVDAAVNEHVSNLRAAAEMPATDPKSAKLISDIKNTLETRSFSDWRKFHTDMKTGFAKVMVSIVADRFKPRSGGEQSVQLKNQEF